jgi:acetoin utilization deacetylase AcuC-like enzyme
VAIAAAWATQPLDTGGGGLERVMIVDWDIHHGNGTQQIFERSSNVLCE